MTSQVSGPPMVGEYAVQTRLGEGGMGVVHLARHPDGRRVALKVLRPHVVGDDEARQRFAREIESLERVRSPWVAEILDADAWGEVPYVVTRYVPGLSLHHHVTEHGPLEGSDLTWFAGCLAEGIAAVHAAGVLHRDVKPGNVLMEGRTPILIDFGLARIAEDQRLTQTGWLLGTPGYLAPEILHGDAPTPAMDVHAWAATVAWAATGRNPFGRGPSMAVMDRTRRGEHDLTGMTGSLADVVEAALDPDPLARPPLREILAWLRPLTTRPELPAVAPPLSGRASRVRTTAYADPAPEPTRVLEVPPPPGTSAGDGRAAALEQWEEDWDRPLAVPQRAGFLERVRRGVLLLFAAAAVGAATAAAPWVAAALVVLTVWLVRSASLTVTATRDRQLLRGRRWYDAPRGVATTPWHLLRGVGGTLVLALWAAGLGLAAGVVVAAAGQSETVTLFAAGSVAAIALWPGPGSQRFRGPLARVARPLARRPLGWVLCCLVLLLVVGVLVVRSEVSGIVWFPVNGAPFGLW